MCGCGLIQDLLTSLRKILGIFRITAYTHFAFTRFRFHPTSLIRITV